MGSDFSGYSGQFVFLLTCSVDDWEFFQIGNVFLMSGFGRTPMVHL